MAPEYNYHSKFNPLIRKRICWSDGLPESAKQEPDVEPVREGPAYLVMVMLMVKMLKMLMMKFNTCQSIIKDDDYIGDHDGVGGDDDGVDGDDDGISSDDYANWDDDYALSYNFPQLHRYTDKARRDFFHPEKNLTLALLLS